MNKTIMVSNMLWRFFERSGAQAVSLIVSVIIARLLSPDDYGTVALVSVFIAIMQVFVDSGMGSALIQKKAADDLDFSSAFYCNIFMCLLLYIILFVSAPAIATFYENTELISLIRVLGLILIISGLKNIQQAYVSRNMMFKKFFFATLGGTIAAAVVGITMACSGYGVWALVAQTLVNSVADTIILWVSVKWRPQKVFSFQRLKSLFSYGWKLLLSTLINTSYNELQQLIIGKAYTTNELAFWNKGQHFPNLLVTNINSSLDSVLFPSMSAEQDHKDMVKKMTRRTIKTSSYLMMPMLVGLAVCAEPIVRLVLTEKWLPSVFYLRVFCFSYAFYPIHTANLSAINAMGRSDVFLKLEIAKKIVGVIAILLTMWISVEAMAYSLIATTIISVCMNSIPNRKIIGYSFGEQLKDVFPSIILSTLMGIIVSCVFLLHFSDWATLGIQVFLGIVIYYLGSKMLHFESFEYLVSLLEEFKKQRMSKQK